MKRLVLADDHVVLREALCQMLEKKGKYSVVAQAGDGEELLDVLKNQQPDLIILDISMPRLDGLGAIERLGNSPGTPPVLILSADECDQKVRQALKAGAKGYIPKNAGLEELEFAIDSILSGKTYLSPSVTASLMNGGEPLVANKDALSVLSKREKEILRYLADGMPNREIGKLLHISTRTVDTHRSNILKKLKLRTNAELVKLAITCGLVTI